MGRADSLHTGQKGATILFASQMGNSKGKTVAEGFKDTCHPGLTPAVYDTDQQMLVVSIHARDGIELWRKDVAPLMNSRHLLLPYKYSSQEAPKEDACCMPEDTNQPMMTYQVFYLPFFYTLEKEILTRRQKNALFREQELWKLTGYLCKAILEWTQGYSQEKLGVICPSNVLINPQGQVRLTTKLSFFLQVFGSFNQFYTPPESRGSSMIKYALNPHRDPRAIESSLVYSMGSVILEAATLTLADYESTSREQKELTFRSLNYSGQLKTTVLEMMQSNQMGRVRVKEVLGRVRLNRNKH